LEGGARKTKKQRKYLPGKPIVSVITVVRNDKNQLKKTFNNVTCQNYPNIEYIIIDGASNDGTGNWLLTLDSDVIDYWVSEPDGGISDAFNKGIRHAQGDWIFFLNAGDEFIDAYVIRDMIAVANDCSIVTAFACYANNEKKTIPRQVKKNTDSLFQRSWICHQATFVRRDVFNNVGLFNEGLKVRMDFDFWLRALAIYEFKFINKSIVKYDHQGISSTQKDLFRKEELEILQNHVDLSHYVLYFLMSKLKYLIKDIIGIFH